MYRFLFIFFTIPLSCSLPKYPGKWEKQGVFDKKQEVQWEVGNTGKQIKLLYNGCGGIAIDDGHEVLLTDPYFSNNSFFKILLGKIKTHQNSVELGLERMIKNQILPKKVNHVLIAHSHYDHLLDLPYLYSQNSFNEKVRIYGSTSSFNGINKFIPDTSFKNLEDNLYDPSKDSLQEVNWIYLSETLRILPIKGDHAPHFLNIHMMKGEIPKEGVKDFDEPTDKTYAPNWKDGMVFSFLIDFISNGKIELRIFHQSSSCDSPFGFPPPREILKKKIDVALIGVASSHNTKDYPVKLLKFLQPEKVILIHWEDFFRPIRKAPKTVRFTNFNTFYDRIKTSYHINDLSKLEGKVVMPSPGTIFTVNY